MSLWKAVMDHGRLSVHTRKVPLPVRMKCPFLRMNALPEQEP
jgi:hypothetical protein